MPNPRADRAPGLGPVACSTPAGASDPPARPVRAATRQRGERLAARGGAASTSTTRRTGSPTRRCGCCCSSPRSPACAGASTRCSPARRSTSPRTAPCCTSRCAPRAGERIDVDGVNVVPAVHEVLGRMAEFADKVRAGAGSGHTGKPIAQHRQHRHRRLRPRPGDGLRGAAALQRARADLPLRLQRRRHRLRRGDPRPRPGRDAVHRLVQDVHDARDDDERDHRARLDAGRAAATSPRSRSTSSRCRPTPKRSASSASTS